MKRKLNRTWLILMMLPLLLLLNTRIEAQEQPENRSSWVSGSINLFYDGIIENSYGIDFGDGTMYQIREKSEGVQIGFGYGIRRDKNWFSEVSLQSLMVGTEDELTIIEKVDGPGAEPISGINSRKILVYLRYEYGKWIELGKSKKIQLGLSLSLSPFFSYNNREPKISQLFPTREMKLGLDLHINPQLSYSLGPRTSLVVKIPIGFSRTTYRNLKLDYPLFSEDERNRESFKSEFVLGQIQSSIGIRYRL